MYDYHYYGELCRFKTLLGQMSSYQTYIGHTEFLRFIYEKFPPKDEKVFSIVCRVIVPARRINRPVSKLVARAWLIDMELSGITILSSVADPDLAEFRIQGSVPRTIEDILDTIK